MPAMKRFALLRRFSGPQAPHVIGRLSGCTRRGKRIVLRNSAAIWRQSPAAPLSRLPTARIRQLRARHPHRDEERRQGRQYPPRSMPLPRMRQVLAACLAAMIAAGATAARADILIGLSLPLSGNAAKLGQQFLDGARAAIEDHNAGGGEPAALTISDDNCDGEIAKLAAAELLDARPDIVTGLLCNEPAYHFAGKFRESGIPIVVAGARSIRLTRDRWREEWNVWRLSPADGDGARAATAFLGERWAGSAYAIVDDGTVYGRTLADTFRAGMEERGLPPLFQENFRPTQSTQARLVRRLRRAGVTHAFIGASGEDVAMIARNAAELEIPIALAGGGELDILPFLPEEDRPPAGLLAVMQMRGSDIEAAAAVMARLEEAGIPPDDHVLQGYRAIEVALSAARPGDPAGSTAALLETRFETVLGPVRFNEEGANIHSPFALYSWNGEGFSILQAPVTSPGAPGTASEPIQ